jgi:uncharacterized surface protein with fasciclin (FAS1) repeats
MLPDFRQRTCSRWSSDPDRQPRRTNAVQPIKERSYGKVFISRARELHRASGHVRERRRSGCRYRGDGQEAGSFQTLLTAAEAAGLVDTLKSEGPFTVFAPTDEAFAKLPEGTVEDLLKPEDQD